MGQARPAFADDCAKQGSVMVNQAPIRILAVDDRVLLRKGIRRSTRRERIIKALEAKGQVGGIGVGESNSSRERDGHVGTRERYVE